MNATNQHIANERAKRQQHMYALQQQINVSPCQQQSVQPLQKLDGNHYRTGGNNNNNNNPMMGSQRKGGQQQVYHH